MRNIKVFFDNSLYIWFWLQPLYWAIPELKQRGFKVSFAGTPSIDTLIHTNWRKQFRRLDNLDIVFLAFHHKSEFCNLPKEDRVSILKEIQSKACKVIWLDCSDSTGTCMFDVLPYVDVYLKKQLLKDKDLYLQPMSGQRIFIDYYVKNGLASIDDESYQGIVENPEDIKKLDLSWNVSLWNGYKGGLLSKLCKLFSIDAFSSKAIHSVDSIKDIKIFFNGTIPKQDNALTYQRKELIRRINSLEKDDCEAPTELLKRDMYVDKMKRSLLLPSPYGWGEICSRDFEVFQFGGCLVKPSMEHLDTFPNLYIPEATYIPLDWDFSNFDEIISRASTTEGIMKIKEIAKNGQLQFLKYRERHNVSHELANHLCSTLKNHGI